MTLCRVCDVSRVASAKKAGPAQGWPPAVSGLLAGVLALVILIADVHAQTPDAQRNSSGAPQYVFTLDGRLKPISRQKHLPPAVQRYVREYQRADSKARDLGLPPLPIRRSIANRVSFQPTGFTGLPLQQPVDRELAANAAPPVSPEANVALPTPRPEPDEEITATQEKASPDVWSPAQIKAARDLCDRIVAETKAIVTPLPPVKNGACGDPAPVRLAGFAGSSPVTFSPPAKVNCELAGALAKWIQQDLQASARKHLGAPITKVSVMSDYACRNTYGRPDTKLSQHALANALDIGGFVSSDGKRAQLIKHWGLTKRDIAAQIAAATKAAQKKEAGTKPNRESDERTGAKTEPDADVPLPASAPSREREDSQIGERRIAPAFGESAANARSGDRRSIAVRQASATNREFEVNPNHLREMAAEADGKREEKAVPLPGQKLGGPAPKQVTRPERPRAASEDKSRMREAARSGSGANLPGKDRNRPSVDKGRTLFLREAHRSACKIFGTVLGPEANEAHRDHFHVDLAPRRYRNYCE